jgi:hypothetical protein
MTKVKREIFYEFSGSHSSIGILIALAIGIPSTFIIGYIYNVIITLLPIVYFNFLISGGLGALIGLFASELGYWGKIRNQKIRLTIAGIIGFTLWIFQWYCYLIYLVTNTEKLMTRADVKKIVGIYSLEQLELSIEDDDLNDELLIRLGHVAEVKIDKLINHKILAEEDGYLKSLCPNPKLKISITKKHLPKLYKFFKEKNMHGGTNLMYAYQESIPRETIKKIVNIQYDAFMKCYQLMESDKCSDGEIYLLTSYFDSLEYN